MFITISESTSISVRHTHRERSLTWNYTATQGDNTSHPQELSNRYPRDRCRKPSSKLLVRGIQETSKTIWAIALSLGCSLTAEDTLHFGHRIVSQHAIQADEGQKESNDLSSCKACKTIMTSLTRFPQCCNSGTYILGIASSCLIGSKVHLVGEN